VFAKENSISVLYTKEKRKKKKHTKLQEKKKKKKKNPILVANAHIVCACTSDVKINK